MGYQHILTHMTWPQNSKLMLARVPWGSDYRDIVRFDDRTALDDYLTNRTGKIIQLDRTSLLKPNEPIAVPTPINEVMEYNYIRVFNPAQPIPGDKPRAYYYFINDVQYVAPNTTMIHVQLDVWSTFGYEIQFGNAFLEQGHAGIAAENAFDDYGRNFLSAPEGLDIGDEYRIVKRISEVIASTRLTANYSYAIMVISSVDLLADAGIVKDPKLNTATGSLFENLPNGATYYFWKNMGDFARWLESMRDKPWVTQGIMSVMAIPPLDRYNIPVVWDTSKPNNPGTVQDNRDLSKRNTHMMENWREAGLLNQVNNGRYAHLKKFLTSPYCMIELTMNTGTPIVLKPEAWRDANMNVIEVAHLASASPRIGVYPYHYNWSPASGPDSKDRNNSVQNDNGEHYDAMTMLSNFPSFSVVNNGFMSYLASNKNSIAYQHSSADWSQQKALAGNQLSFDQSTAAMQASYDLTTQGIGAANAQTDLANQTQAAKVVTNGVAGIVGGAVGGGAIGAGSGAANALMGGINAAIDTASRNQATAISTGLSAANYNTTNNNATFNRDTNKNYADWAAKGDYSQTIAGINARVQDAKMTQPTTSGQIGGDAFLLSTYQWGYDVKIKLLNDFAMRIVGEYWLRFGYRLGFFIQMPSDLRLMTKFTFWKLKECYVVSARCPEPFKQAIRGIFESGVTVWSNPSDIGTIDIADNQPKGGFRL